MRLGVDIDSVLCDSIPSLLARINHQQGTHLKKADVVQWDFPVRGSTLGELILEAFRDGAFVLSLPVMDGAQEAIRHLVRDFDIVVVTSREESTVDATRVWVEDHFGPLPVVHTGESKNGHDLDLLIDDGPHNVKAFANAGRPAILFDQPWNQTVGPHPLIIRCRNWQEICQVIYTIIRP